MSKNITYSNIGHSHIVTYKSREWVQQSWLVTLLLTSIDELISCAGNRNDIYFLNNVRNFIIENKKYSNFQEESINKVKERIENAYK